MTEPQQADLQAKLEALRHEYDELERALPRHSVKASQIMRLEALEDSIADVEAALRGLADQGDGSGSSTS